MNDREVGEEAIARLAAIVTCADDAIYSLDVDTNIRSWNEGAVRLFGYAPEDVIGKPIEVLLPAGVDDMASMRERLQRGEVVSRHETVRRRKDGSLVDVSLSVNPIRGSGGVHLGFAAIARDISGDKLAKQRLAQTERLASLGTLAAGMGHELNSPLSVIVANLDFMRAVLEDVPLDGETRQSLGEALGDSEEASRRVARIISDLMKFARGDSGVKTLIEVPTVLESAIRMTSTVVRHQARLVRQYGDTPRVQADEGRLTQVFTNVLINAAQAIEALGGEQREIVISTSTSAAGRAIVEVRDNGCGIARDAMPRVFDPFFTTRPVGSGLGLGLGISHAIVTSLGGEILVESEPGKGSLFRVSLPAAS